VGAAAQIEKVPVLYTETSNVVRVKILRFFADKRVVPFGLQVIHSSTL